MFLLDLPTPFTSLAHRGVALYKNGEFWKAHEAWEEVWQSLNSPAPRRALQALIQIAAARYLLGRARPAPAARLCRLALVKLESVGSVAASECLLSAASDAARATPRSTRTAERALSRLSIKATPTGIAIHVEPDYDRRHEIRNPATA